MPISDARMMMLSTDLEGDLRAAFDARIAQARIGEAGGPRAAARDRPTSAPRRVLLVGYNGACNTGADLRTGEILRQLRAALGVGRIEVGLLAMGDRPLPDWDGVAVERIQGFPPDAVLTLCDSYDAVVVCEGSLFTSTFSDAMAALLTAFLGMATALGKPAVAFGVEADRMTVPLEAFVRRHASGALLIARNGRSRRRLAELGLDAVVGTDTGWSYRTRDPGAANAILRGRGWDGKADVLALCPMDPFRWPLVADPERAMLATLSGEPDPEHHQGMMFFQPGRVATPRREAFLDGLAAATRAHAAGRATGLFPVVIGMEAIDGPACAGLAARVGAPEPLVAGTVAPDHIVAVLRSASRLVSARYHAVLLAMSAGVPALGLASDGRIPALLRGAGHGELALRVDDPDLAAALTARLDGLARDGAVGRAFADFARRQRRIQAAMGRRAARHLARGWR